MEISSYFIDMKNTSRKPYIYKVTNLETGQYYIGSQCSGKTIGKNYFTSSTNKAFKDGFKTYGEEKYKIVIIKEFEDPEECVEDENYMIRDHMLLKDGLCLNRSYCCGGKRIFSTVGRPSPNRGKHQPISEETKQKISISLKGTHHPHTEETKQKISISLKGFRQHEDVRKKMGEAHRGIYHTEEAKQKMSLASPRRIKISIEGNVFDSLTAASKYYNVSINKIRYWVKNKKHNAVYIEK